MERKPKAFLLTVVSALVLAPTGHARPIDLEVGYRRFGDDLWNRFTGLNTQSPAVWDAGPEQGEAKSGLEASLRWQRWDKPWGTIGLSATLSLPYSAESTGTPQGNSALTKETSVWGYRIGPNARFYLSPDPGWFVDGTAAIGQFLANQRITGSSSGELSALAYSFELGLAVGYEWKPSAGTSLFAKIGYSRLTSSFFSAQSTSGHFYSDFEPGTRLAVTGPGGNEDLKLNASGFLLTVGMRFETGKKASKWSRVPERATPAPEPTPEPSWEDSATPDAPTEPAAEPTPAPEPSPSPAPSAAPSPTPTPTPAPEAPTVTLDPEPPVEPLPEPARRMDLPPGLEEPPSPMQPEPTPAPTGIDEVPDLEDAPANLRPERAGRDSFPSLD